MASKHCMFNAKYYTIVGRGRGGGGGGEVICWASTYYPPFSSATSTENKFEFWMRYVI